MTKKHVAVLMGGLSAEREVSLTSGKAVVQALEEQGYQVTAVDVDRNVAQVLKELNPDVVFNALHGTYGEDGCIQGLLECMGLPYTHSGVRSSAVAMHKPTTKKLLSAEGITFPRGKVVSREQLLKKDLMPRPYVVKPVSEGSSVGVVIITKESAEKIPPEKLCPHSKLFLVEEYIEGREISCAVLDGKALGVVELQPKTGFYDYENKYTDGRTEHVMPAPLPEGVYQGVMKIAENAHRLLECRGLTRTDMRYYPEDENSGRVYMLEVNTHPGLTPLSLAPEMAKHAGISFNALVQRLVEGATCDY